MSRAHLFNEMELAERGEDEPRLVVDLAGFEGPLDLLLDLARRQKVDLSGISILALADQYLAFVEQARRIRIELAADYLVMAAWLAYLKSRLLLPEPAQDEGPSAAEMAGALALRLKRLEEMRHAARLLMDRDQLGRDVFARGAPDMAMGGVSMGGLATPGYDATLYDLLAAYARRRQTQALARVTVLQRRVWGLTEAREAITRLIGAAHDWLALDDFLIAYVVEPGMRATVRASALAAILECAKDGRTHLRQDRPFGPIYARSRPRENEPEVAA